MKLFGGWVGHLIDILAVTRLIWQHRGWIWRVQQANAGLQFVFGVPVNATVQVILIAGITAVALVSVVRGLEGGVKLLSEVNMILAFVLMIFVLIAAGAVAIFTDFISGIGAYAMEIIPLSNPHQRVDEGFMQGWTAFFTGLADISWSPFVGMFIARGEPWAHCARICDLCSVDSVPGLPVLDGRLWRCCH